MEPSLEARDQTVRLRPVVVLRGVQGTCGCEPWQDHPLCTCGDANSHPGQLCPSGGCPNVRFTDHGVMATTALSPEMEAAARAAMAAERVRRAVEAKAILAAAKRAQPGYFQRVCRWLKGREN